MANSQRKQKGFTLVELSVVLVVAGLLLAAVTKGQDFINTAKADKMVADLRSTEALITNFQTAKGRLPGDCNADGVIDYNATATTRGPDSNSTRAALYDFTNDQVKYAADASAATAKDGCAKFNGSAAAGVADVWINDLKLAGLVQANAANRLLAKQVNEDFMFVGKIVDETSAGDTSADGEYNAIVIHNVPQWMARRMAVAINGSDANADRGRLRQLKRGGVAGEYETTWDKAGSETGATSDAVVSIVYFLGRIPTASAFAVKS